LLILRISLGKPACRVFGDHFDFEIPPSAIANPIPESLQFTGRIRGNTGFPKISVPVNSLIIFYSAPPPVSTGAKRLALNTMQWLCNEDQGRRDAVNAVNFAVRKLPVRHVPATPIPRTIRGIAPRESLEFIQCCLHGSRMRFKNPLVITEEAPRVNNLICGWRERKIQIEDPTIGSVLVTFQPAWYVIFPLVNCSPVPGC